MESRSEGIRGRNVLSITHMPGRLCTQDGFPLVPLYGVHRQPLLTCGRKEQNSSSDHHSVILFYLYDSTHPFGCTQDWLIDLASAPSSVINHCTVHLSSSTHTCACVTVHGSSNRLFNAVALGTLTPTLQIPSSGDRHCTVILRQRTSQEPTYFFFLPALQPK